MNRAMDDSKYGDSKDNSPSDPTQRLTVVFDPNGGTVDETSKLATVGELIGELPIPTREGHGFLGWFTGLGGIHPKGMQVFEDTFVTTDMVILYAHWSEDGE